MNHEGSCPICGGALFCWVSNVLLHTSVERCGGGVVRYAYCMSVTKLGKSRERTVRSYLDGRIGGGSLQDLKALKRS